MPTAGPDSDTECKICARRLWGEVIGGGYRNMGCCDVSDICKGRGMRRMRVAEGGDLIVKILEVGVEYETSDLRCSC